MGASSGKLVITENNAADNATPNQQNGANHEPANQEAPTTLINGHAEVEQACDSACISTVEGQANGDVSTTETADKPGEIVAPEKTPKKHKNSLIRIPNRLSKISFSFNFGNKKRCKSAPTKVEEPTQEPEVAEQKPDDSVIAGVADNLVQEVITSATTTHAETLIEEQKEIPRSPEVVTHVIEETTSPSQPPTEMELPTEITPEVQVPKQIESEIPVLNNKEEIILNGDHEIHEQITNHILDSNNTNSTTFEYVNGDSHPQLGDNDAIISKLTNLELTNGHSDHIVEVPVALNGQDQ